MITTGCKFQHKRRKSQYVVEHIAKLVVIDSSLLKDMGKMVLSCNDRGDKFTAPLVESLIVDNPYRGIWLLQTDGYDSLSDDTVVVLYTDMSDGSRWARALTEFSDGRFVELI